MKTKHTTGEWEVVKIKDGDTSYKVCAIGDKTNSDGKRLVLANCFFEEAWNDSFMPELGRKQSEVRRTRECALANAKLIAASPELLEALLDCVEYMKKVNNSDDGDQALQRAENAIKKATE